MLNTNSHAGGEAPAAEPRKPRGIKRILAAAAAAALVAGAAVFGSTLPDPKASEAYAALSAEKSSTEAERDTARSDYEALQSKYDALESGMAARESKVAARESAASAAEAATKTAAAAVKKREDAVTGAEKTKAANTIGDGTWTVGTDIAPGTYRAAAAVGSTCYWGIYETGSNGSNIIENDLPGGGRPTVMLSAGQDFKSSRCGDWVKQ